MDMSSLRPGDVRYVVSRIPPDIQALLRTTPTLMLGGGFIRATIAREDPSDLNIFGPDLETLSTAADALRSSRSAEAPAKLMASSKNAWTLLCPPRLPVQFISRWLHNSPTDLIASFDFTVAQAAICHTALGWVSVCHPDFYVDLAARRLVYTSPARAEDAGGSIMRVRKFLAKGYRIHPVSLGAVIARLVRGIPAVQTAGIEEKALTRSLIALLFEVDPNVIIDGLTVTEEMEAQ